MFQLLKQAEGQNGNECNCRGPGHPISIETNLVIIQKSSKHFGSEANKMSLWKISKTGLIDLALII